MLFRFLNTSKRSAAVDCTTAAGRAQVARADGRRRSGRREPGARRDRGAGTRAGGGLAAQPARVVRVHLALRPRRPVEPASGDGVHAAGLVRLDGRARDAGPAADRGGRAARRVARRHVRGRRGPHRPPRHAPGRARDARRSRAPRGDGAHDGAERDGVGAPRRPSEPVRAHRRDPVDRAGARRLGRVLHDHRAAVARLPGPDRAARPRRRRRAGALGRAHPPGPGRERDDPWLDATARRRRDRRARGSAAHPRRRDRHGRHGDELRAVRRAWRLRPPSRRGVRTAPAALSSVAGRPAPAVAGARARRARLRVAGRRRDGAATRTRACDWRQRAARRSPRHRLHRVLGRSVRDAVPGRDGRGRHQGGIDPASRRHALPERPAAHQRRMVGVERALSHRQPGQARHHARPRPPRRHRAGHAASRGCRRRGGELLARG